MKKKILFLLSVLLLSTAAISQPLYKEWDFRFGGRQQEYLYSLHRTSDAGYILGGSSESDDNGDKTQPGWGLYDYWIVKADSSGSKQWDVRFGGDENDYLYEVIPLEAGGYLLSGYSHSGVNGDKTQENWGNGYDFWIVKTDGDGIKLWDQHYGGNNEETLIAALPSGDGSFLLGGTSDSKISGDISEAALGYNDFWIIKIDSNGNKQWDKRYGTTYADLLQCMLPTTDGGYILGGVTFYYDSSGFDLLVIKIDDAGTEQWRKTFTTSGYDFLKSIAQPPDGSYIIGAFSYDSFDGDKTQPTHGGFDFWIIKTDANGNKQWDVSIGGDADDFLSTALVDDDGYLFAGQSASGIGGDVSQESRGYSDYWMIKTDANGQRLWDSRFGGDEFDYLTACIQTANDGLLLGGYTASNAFGDKSQNSWNNSFDYWIVKVKAEADTAENCVAPGDAVTTTVSGTSAMLSWGSVNGAKGYNVIYKQEGSDQWNSVSTIHEWKKLTGLIPSTEYLWRVKSLCEVSPSLFSKWSALQSFATTSLKNSEQPEDVFEVVPNPFQQSATITYSTANDARMQIALYDISGKLMKILVNANVSSGMHTLLLSSEGLSQGIYLLKFQVNDELIIRKVVIE